MSNRRASITKRVMRTTILTSFLASQMVPGAMADPSGGNVVAGQGLITKNGRHTQIDQSSDRLIIEWDNFDTSAQESVRFAQPGRDAMALNRVLSGQATRFDGSLFANGNIVIVNGAGIHFGPTSVIDVGGLIASTADITNSNFLSNRLIFDQPGQPDAMVTNAGDITVRDAGLAALVAPGVENSGLIRAELGTVILASGETHTIDFRGDGLISFAITSPTTTTPKRQDGSDAKALVTNSGTVEADGGSVVMTASQASRVLDTAINMKGVVRANSVGVRNGKIVLGGGSKGRVRVAGKVRARGTTRRTRGGTVHITGESVAVRKAQIDVSGAAGGGKVLIGGAARGGALEGSSDVGYLKEDDLLKILVGDNAGAAGDGFIPTASNTSVDADSVIDASSSFGNGGSVIVWGTDEVNFHGSVNTLGGDNGFVEVSTKGTGIVAGSALTGHMLVDPGDVCIFLSSTAGCAAGATGVTFGTITDVLNIGGLFELNTDVTGTSGTGRVDFGGGFVLNINNSSGTTGTFEIHAADTIDTNQVAIQDNGTSGTNFEWYAGSSETGAPVASADIILGPQVLNTGGGNAHFEAADDILISDPVFTGGGDATFIARGGAGGSSIVVGAEGNPSDDHIDTTDGAGNAGTVTFQTDSFTINPNAATAPGLNAVVDAAGSGGIVTFRSTTSGRAINLGTADAGSLSFTAGDIDRIAADVLRIGSLNAGDITVSAAINPAQVDTLSLITGGGIIDANGTGDDITVTNLAMQAFSGIAGGDFLETAVTTLAVLNVTNPVSISNTGALTIGTVDGVSGLGSIGAVDIVTASPLTIAANLSAVGDITATAGESGATDTDNITVNAGVNVISSGGNVTLRAGDDVALGNNAIVSAAGMLTLTAGHNDTDGDGGISTAAATLAGASIGLSAIDDIVLGTLSAVGGTVDITSTNGAIIDGNDVVGGLPNIIAQSLSLSANTGIGGAGVTATLETQVENLEAQTDTGGIFLSNFGDLTIGGVTGALNGVQVVTSGDIELTNQGSIDINVAGESVVGPAAVTVVANGATADIVTGNNAIVPNAAVQSTGGTVTLRAGQDLLLGDTAGAGTLGNVFSGGSVVLDAGRDIIVDTGTFVQASGAGTITANAGRNISVIDTSGPFAGAEIRTEGGDITLTTGAGGVFTANNGASPAVQTTVAGGNGNITINADAMDIQNSISTGTGIVTLQTVTNGQLIDLGTNTVGSLSLTDAEIDQITASTLRIGSANAGSITVSDTISPASTGTLSLITGDQIIDGNAAAANINVANLAMQAVNGIGSTNTLDLGVGTVAAVNSTSGSIRLLQLTGLGDLTVGTVDGVVGVSNQETTGLSQTRIQTQASNLIINNDIFSARDALLVSAGGNSLLDNNAAISTGGGFGIDLQSASMALEGGTVTAGLNGRVRINPFFVGQAVDLGSTSDAGAALELSDAELDTISAGTLQIGQFGIGDIPITDAITLTNINTLDLVTSGAVLDNNLGTDITVNNLALRTGGGVGTAGDAVGLDVNNLAFANTGGVVNLSNIGNLAITAVDGVATSSNTGTTTTIGTLGVSTLTFAVDTSSSGNADFTSPTITVNNGADIAVTAGTLAFNAPTVNLDGNLSATGGITGTAATVNVLGSTGGAEIQDAVDVAAAGATVNVGDGTFAGGILIDKALTMLGDGFTATTTVNVADNTVGMTVNASNVTIDGFQFTGDGTPTNATGILVDGSGSALANILVGDSNADNQGSRFTGLTTGLQVADGGTGNAIGIEIGLGNVFDTSTDGIVLDGAGVNLTGDTFNNVSFAGITGDFIRLENGVEFLPGSPTVLDATAVTFDGVLGGALSVAQALAVENKLVHFLDDPTLGLLNIGQLVVPNGNSIQLAVNAAGILGGAQTVSVGAGTFGGSVEVWVDDLILQGLGATTIIDTDAIDAFANNGDADNGFQVAAISALSGGGDVTGVIIDGFAFDTVTTTGTNIGVELGETGVSTAQDSVVQNSNFTDLLDGVVANAVGDTTTISSVIMTGIASNGIDFLAALDAGDTILIENSSIASTDDAVRFSSTLMGTDVTITGNTLEGASDGLEFADAISNGSDITISGNERIEGLGTFADEDGLGDAIAFRGAISDATTTILIDDNTLIRGDDRGINFADVTTGGPATVTDASVTISRNDEIRGTRLDGILFNADLTNATILIGGPSAADGNGLIIGNGESLDIENVIGGSFTVANNGRIEGTTGDGIELEGQVSNGAQVTILGNTSIAGGNNGVIFEDAISDSTVDINGNNGIAATFGSGISVVRAVQGTSVFNINSNNIGSAVARVGQAGILFAGGVLGTSTVNIGGTNQVFATGQAIQINNLQSPTTVAITGGTYNGTGGALLVSNALFAGTDGRLNVGAAAFVSGAASTAMEVRTNAGNAGVDIDFNGAATFNGGTTGIRLSGPGIDILNDTLGTIAFTGQTGNYIELANGAEFLPGSPTVLDATAVTFDGVLGGALSFAQALAVENKLVHFLDDPTLGLLNIGQLVVPNGNSIQLAVNAAGILGGAQTVSVGAGTFGGSVEVWVDDLILQGLGATTIIDTDAIDAFANNGDADNGFQIAAISALSGGGDVTGVIIDGFSFDTVTTTGSNIGVELGETGVSTAQDSIVQNSNFTDLLDGVVANAVGDTTTISSVVMTGIASNGIDFLAALDAGDTILIENSSIASTDDAVRFSSTLTGTDVTITGSTLEGASDGLEFADAISNGSDITISGNERIEGLGTFADEDGLGDGIVFRGAISDAATTILIDDNTLIRGDDRGINFADATTGGPATVTDASITISRNDEIRGTILDGILFNADLTNATILIGGPTAADGNGLIIGNDEGLDIENVIGGSFTVANNGRIEGATGDSIEFEGQVSNGAQVTISGNTAIAGANDGVIFEDPIRDSTIDIAGNAEIRGGGDGISIFDATDSTINVTGNTGIFGDGADAIFVQNDLTNSDVSIDNNETVLGAVNGVNVGTIVGGSFAVANNGLVRGTFGDGIITGPLAAGADVSITDNIEIRGDADGIAIFDATDSTINITGNTGIFGDGFDAIFVLNDLTNSAVSIDGNETVLGAVNGVNVGAIVGGSFAVANNGLVRGTFGDGIITGPVAAGADVSITDNTEIRGDADGIAIFDATDSTINITGNTGIFGDGFDAIFVLNDLTNSDVSIDGNETVLGAVNGVNVGTIVGGSFAVANNGLVRGTFGDGIITGPLAAGADVSITDNTEIRGDADGIAIFDATDSTINITGNTGIFGDGFDAIFVFAGLTDSLFTVSENGEIVGLDDGMNIDFISGGSFTVRDNISIRGGAGSGMEFEGPVTNVATFVVDNNTITGGEEAIEFDTPATITDSTLTFTRNTLQAGSDGILFAGQIRDSTIDIARNSEIRGGANGISIFGTTDSTINVTGNTRIFGDGSDAIFVLNDLTNSDVSIDGNETVLGAQNGVNVGAIVGGSFAVANNGLVRGTFGDGIITGPVAAGADMGITDNTEIRGDADGIAIFDATDSTINITGNTGIFGDGSDAILVFAGLTDSLFTVSENGEIVGLDDGMNIDFISGGSFTVRDNMSIRGGAGSGMEFVGPVTNVATFVVDNNRITGGEEAIEFDTPATITDSTLTFTGNTLQAGTDGLLFDGRVMDSMVTSTRNTIAAGENGISFSNLASGSSFSVDASDIVGGQNGLAVTGSNLGGGNSTITLGQSSFRGERAAGISITTRAGGSGITTQFDSRVTTTGSPALALSGPNQAIAGNDIGNVDFNSVGGGNFITLSNGALFEPGRPTIISGLGASFDGTVITANVESQTIDWVESRIIDFDDNATLGQIFFFNLPFLFDNGFEGSPVRLSNVQTPGDWILRPDFIFQILATNPLIDDYGLGTCLFEISEESQLPVPRCVAPAGEADPSPSILRYMEGMEQLSALQ